MRPSRSPRPPCRQIVSATGRTRTSTILILSQAPLPIALRWHGTPGGIRTPIAGSVVRCPLLWTTGAMSLSVADEGVEPPPPGCGPDALPLHQSAASRRRHEESNLDFQCRRLASCPLDDDGILSRAQGGRNAETVRVASSSCPHGGRNAGATRVASSSCPNGGRNAEAVRIASPFCPLLPRSLWRPDQESNLDPPLRRREHCPLCYRGLAPPAGFEPASAG